MLISFDINYHNYFINAITTFYSVFHYLSILYLVGKSGYLDISPGQFHRTFLPGICPTLEQFLGRYPPRMHV